MNGITAIHQMRKEKIPALVRLVKAGHMTSEKAARILSDSTREIIKNCGGNTGVDQATSYRIALHDIESRLPEYNGIVVGRHM